MFCGKPSNVFQIQYEFVLFVKHGYNTVRKVCKRETTVRYIMFINKSHIASSTIMQRLPWGVLPVPTTRDERLEILDTAIDNREELAANLADIRQINHWLGHQSRIARILEPICDEVCNNQLHSSDSSHSPHRSITLLDVATGSADIPLGIHHQMKQQGRHIRIYASDISMDVLHIARQYVGETFPLVCHNALQLPYADNTFDIVTCDKALHHFDPESAVALLREMARVASCAVVITDLSRSWFAYWAARILGLVQRSAISRHDGPLSVLRAYIPSELVALVQQAELEAHITHYALFHLIAVVTPTP